MLIEIQSVDSWHRGLLAARLLGLGGSRPK